MRHFVGVDVGGTRIKAGLVDQDHRVVTRDVRWLTTDAQSEDGMVAAIAELVRALDPEGRAESVGVGVPGAVRYPEGVVTRSPNFPAWNDLALGARVSAALDRQVRVDNDANCVIAGEWLTGSREADVLGLTLGTGVGGALILDGRLRRGVHGMAGEVGHITVDPDGAPCGCGSRGCLETFPSRVGLKRLCQASGVAGVDPESPDLPRLLSLAAERGDPTAQAHFSTVGRALGQALAGILNLLDLSLVLLAGGVAAAFGWMEVAMWAELRSRCYAAIHQDVRVVLGTQGDDAGIVGAALGFVLDLD